MTTQLSIKLSSSELDFLTRTAYSGLRTPGEQLRYFLHAYARRRSVFPQQDELPPTREQFAEVMRCSLLDKTATYFIAEQDSCTEVTVTLTSFEGRLLNCMASVDMRCREDELRYCLHMEAIRRGLYEYMYAPPAAMAQHDDVHDER